MMLRDSKAFTSFAVNDLEAARSFYGGTLGLDITDGPMGILELHLGGGPAVMIYPKDDHQPATYTILNFPVDSVDRAVADLTSAGVEMERYDGPDLKTDERGIARDDRGPTMAWFKDPAGNILSVLEVSASV